MACYANPDPIFQKAMRLVASITQEQRGIVTTSFDHQYITDMFVRLIIPATYGMPQLNNQQVKIEVIDDTSFYIEKDTTDFDPFSVPGSAVRCAQVIPIGAFGTLLAATQNVT